MVGPRSWAGLLTTFPHRPLPAGNLTSLKRSICYAETDECGRVPVNGNDEDGRPTTEHREGVRKRQLLEFGSAIVSEPSSLCVRRDGLRYIFDLGEEHLLVLSSFKVVVHVDGDVPWSFNGGRPADSPPLEIESSLDVEVELCAETRDQCEINVRPVRVERSM